MSVTGGLRGVGGRESQTADRLIAFLAAEGAASYPHAGARTLLDHLVGTYEIVRRWNQPFALQHAALIHSVYGTDVYEQRLVSVSRRADVAEVAGDQAERLAYLFCVTPRDALFAGTYKWAREVSFGSKVRDEGAPASRDELDALVLLHMANLAEQARADDLSPATWLVQVRELAELLIDSDTVALPLFVAQLAGLTRDDESLARRAYNSGVAGLEALEARINRLALAAAACPVVGEPCIWMAHLSRCLGDFAMARNWARAGARRLVGLGVAWDKRLTYEQWLELARLAAESGRNEAPRSASAIGDPRALFDALGDAGPDDGLRVVAPRDAAEGQTRFQRYMESIAEADGPGSLGIYPDLDSQPWYDPSDFPLSRYLQSHFDEIRSEILALDPSRFHRESERIERSGDWDVVFLYERGRRHDDVRRACPVTTRAVEAHAAMRTVAGLIYVSRMRAGTHIRPHHGPTNLRLRCHLAIKVPAGDCAIRVGDDRRHWVEGECLVFDDYFEHEAWNHTEDDRIVLIADMWHPALSATEVRLLEGLHRYAYTYARQLGRYWASNAAARRG
jgi:hypothetical protein